MKKEIVPDCCAHDTCAAPVVPATLANPAPPDGASGGPGLYRVPDMDCAVEEAEIRRALEPVAGIRSLHFQLGARTLRINAPSELLPVAVEAIERAGYRIEPASVRPVDSAHDHAGGHDGHEDHDHGVADSPLRLGMALGLAIAAEAIEFAGLETLPWKAAIFLLAIGAIWLAGIEVYRKGIRALLHRKLNINALMSVAVTGALAIGQWPEAAMVMALYAIAELIEARAADRARNAIAGLVDLAPAEAEVRGADGIWATVKASEVALESVLRIKPGARVPLDGVVTEGHSAIDQSPVTGESIPVDKAPGDPVYAGTINETGELQFRVTALSADTTLARIIHAVEEAQGTRPAGDPQPLPYLDAPSNREGGALDITLEVWLQTAKMRAGGEEGVRLTRGNTTQAAYWTAAQLVAHHTVNGCNLQPGDLLGSGTLSGPEQSEAGSLLEQTMGGKQPITLANGETRTFLEDGDTLILRGWCERAGAVRIGLGEARGTVVAAV